MPPLDPETSRWFEEQVQPHLPMLRAWLAARFRSARDLEDIVQEALVRVLKARERAPMASAKAFLFATARNLALDQYRHQVVANERSLVSFDLSAVLDENPGVAESVSRSQELALLTEAIQSLPSRCRQVFTLRKIYGLSQKEIAAQLGISECTVSAQLTIGLRKCTEFFAERRGGRP